MAANITERNNFPYYYKMLYKLAYNKKMYKDNALKMIYVGNRIYPFNDILFTCNICKNELIGMHFTGRASSLRQGDQGYDDAPIFKCCINCINNDTINDNYLYPQNRYPHMSRTDRATVADNKFIFGKYGIPEIPFMSGYSFDRCLVCNRIDIQNKSDNVFTQCKYYNPIIDKGLCAICAHRPDDDIQRILGINGFLKLKYNSDFYECLKNTHNALFPDFEGTPIQDGDPAEVVKQLNQDIRVFRNTANYNTLKYPLPYCGECGFKFPEYPAELNKSMYCHECSAQRIGMGSLKWCQLCYLVFSPDIGSCPDCHKLLHQLQSVTYDKRRDEYYAKYLKYKQKYHNVKYKCFIPTHTYKTLSNYP
jgi:hypothetical protein